MADFWDDVKTRVKEGFLPASARADKNIERTKKETGDQLAEDMKLSPEERAQKLRRGFMKRVEEHN